MNIITKFFSKEKFEKSYSISAYECDKNGKLRVVTLMNLLQNISVRHITKLGIGIDFCVQNDLAWVAAKYSLKITAYPKANQKIKIRTWISDISKLAAIREFVIMDSKERILVEVSSKWTLIDLSKRRPVVIAEKVKNLLVLNEKLLSTNYAQSEAPKKVDIIREFTVKYDDIDFNQHVNNSIYPLWASEAVENSFRLEHYPAEIKIVFLKEALFGEKVIVSTEMDELCTRHCIVSAVDGREHAKVAIKWINKSAFT